MIMRKSRNKKNKTKSPWRASMFSFFVKRPAGVSAHDRTYYPSEIYNSYIPAGRKTYL